MQEKIEVGKIGTCNTVHAFAIGATDPMCGSKASQGLNPITARTTKTGTMTCADALLRSVNCGRCIAAVKATS